MIRSALVVSPILGFLGYTFQNQCAEVYDFAALTGFLLSRADWRPVWENKYRLLAELYGGVLGFRPEPWTRPPHFTAQSCEAAPVHVAILGSGIAGLSAAYTFEESNRARKCTQGGAPANGAPYFNVTLIEASSRIGGHSCTVDFPVGNNKTYPVDIAYAYNPPIRGYQPIRRLGRKFGINWQGPLTQRVGVYKHGFEEVSDRENADFDRQCERFMDLVERFKKRQHLMMPFLGMVTFRDVLRALNLTDEFFLLRLYPVIRFIIVAGSKGKMLDSPAVASLELYREGWATCWQNGLHGELGWYGIEGGSESHIRALLKEISFPIHTSSPVRAVRSVDGERSGVAVSWATESGKDRTELFDRVVMAMPPDDARQALGPQSPEFLEDVTTESITLAVHSDKSVLGPLGNDDSKNMIYVASGSDQTYGNALLSVRWDSILGDKVAEPRPILTYSPEIFVGPEKKLEGEHFRVRFKHTHFPTLKTFLQEQDYIARAHGDPKNKIFFAGAWVGWKFSHPGALEKGQDAAFCMGARPDPNDFFLWAPQYDDSEDFLEHLQKTGGKLKVK